MKKALFLLLITSCLTANATVYFVSNAGNDANQGTVLAPIKSLEKVNSLILQPGDSVLFKRGDIFYGSLLINEPGTLTKPIYFGAYGSGNSPVITGFKDVTEWVNLGGNIWESAGEVSSLSTCDLVLINGINTAQGHYPNTGYLTFQDYKGDSFLISKGLENWIGATAVYRNNRYSLTAGLITEQKGDTIFHTGIYSPECKNYGFFIQNDPRTLDTQNEWYYNPKTKKLQIYSTTMPTSVKVAAIDNTIEFAKLVYNYSLTSYVTIENLNVTGANNALILGYPSLVEGKRLNGVTIKNCKLQYSGAYGIKIQTDRTNTTPLNIIGNVISDINLFAISCTYSGIVNILNNSIYNITTVQVPGTQNCAIAAFNVVSANIIENVVMNVGFNAISFQSFGVSVIKNNYINTYCTRYDDGGAITTGGKQALGTIITGNICVNGIGNYQGTTDNCGLACGIYLDDNSSNVEVSNNTVYNCNWIGIYLHNANSNYIHDNTVFNCAIQLRTCDDDMGGDVYNNIFTNNQFICRTATQYAAMFHTNQTVLKPGIFDNNYYTRPVNETGTININKPTSYFNLSGWKQYSGQDINSKVTSCKVISDGDFQFYCNGNKTIKTIQLTKSMTDIKGAKYSGNITLQPYSSLVLVNDNAF